MTFAQSLLMDLALKPDQDLAPLVGHAEEALARRLGFSHVSLNASGLTSLQAALHASGAGPGTEVVCDVMFPFGVLAIRLLGATPIAADIDQVTLTMDPHSLAGAVSNRTRAVIATAAFGASPAVSDLREALRNRDDVILIEDHAQALAGSAGRTDLDVPDLMCLSFQAGKPLSIGHGGAVATNIPALDNAARRYVSLGWYPRTGPSGQVNWESSWMERESVCQSARLPPVGAGLLLARLHQLELREHEITGKVRKLTDLLAARFPGIPSQLRHLGSAFRPWRLALIAPDNTAAADLHSCLMASGSAAYRPGHPPVPLWPCFGELQMTAPPNTSDLLLRIVLLPVSNMGELVREIEAVEECRC